MYIKQLRLYNFGKHKDITLNFTTGVNAIIGETGTGKSTVLKAIKLLLLNTPLAGEKVFQNQNTKEALKIVLKDDQDNILKRSKRTYILNGEEYKAFKNTIPEPVLKAFPVSDEHWQDQHATHFLMFSTGGSIAKTINSLIGLEEQEDILKKIKQETNTCKSETKRILLNKQETEETIEKYKNIPELLDRGKEIKKEIEKNEEREQKFEDLNKKINALQEVESKILKVDTKKFYGKINSLIKNIYALQESENSFSKCETLYNNLLNIPVGKDVSQYFKQIKEIETSLKEVKRKSENVEKLTEKINSIQKILKQTKGDTTLYSKKTKEFLSSIKDIINTEQSMKKIENIIENIAKINKTLKETKKEKEKRLNEFHKTLSELGICPLCGREV